MAVDKEQIKETLLDNFTIHHKYEIEDDGYVSVYGDVKLHKTVDKLPVQFRKVTGNFWCHANKLTTLEGSPTEVGGSFIAWENQFVNLKGAPRRVRQMFSCHTNSKLQNLEGGPVWVGSDYKCSGCELLTDLRGSPIYVGGDFHCQFNANLVTLQGLPMNIGETLTFSWYNNLRLCSAVLSKVSRISVFRSQAIQTIINKYRNTGYSGILPFASELVQAGYGDNAWL
jgi:hypothetical protein